MLRILAVLVCASLMIAVPAMAGVPSAANSTVPNLRACPGGDYENTIVVRDVAGNPVANSQVRLYLSCGVFCLSRFSDVDDYTIDVNSLQQAYKFTDANGVATFHLRITGGCFEPNEQNVLVTADGVVLRDAPIAVTDINSDWVVQEDDYTLLLGVMPDPGPYGDFDGNGTWEPADAAAHAAHLNHDCLVPLPVKPSTWGRIKQIYR